MGFMVENRRLRLAIAARVQTLGEYLTIISPAAVAGMVQSADSITLKLADGRDVIASLAVSAEGREARLRTLAGIG